MLALLAATAEAPSAFAWVPTYPGARISPGTTTRSGSQLIYKFTFHTADSGAKVWSFYQEKLKAAGFHVIGKAGVTGNSWDLFADRPDGANIDLNATAQESGADVRITARTLAARSR